MTGQILEVIKEKTLSDKLHLMADTLRGCKETQCIGKLYKKKSNSFCAYGALGFLSGIPKDKIVNEGFVGILANYGIDLDESGMIVTLPNDSQDMHYPQREVSMFQAIYQLNDHGYSFPEIATYLDYWADDLQG